MDYPFASDYVYLDYAATSPLIEETARAIHPYTIAGRQSIACQGNANGLYRVGRDAFAALEQARKSIAKSLGAKRPDEVIIASGATEADNAALLGLTEALIEKRRLRGEKATPHVIVSAIEHDAVLAPAKRLESLGIEVTYLMPNRQGFIEVESLRKVLKDSTILVSVQAANSEVGSIQPIKELAKAAHELGAFFHTDATQALGKMPFNLEDLDVDAASFSAHKLGGPKGVGALYLKSRTPFNPYLYGGGQELGRRSGTQNVAGVVGFAAAVEAAQDNQVEESRRLRQLRDYLYGELGAMNGIEVTVLVNEGSEAYLPNIVHGLAQDLESETLVLRLDSLGFAVSGGSACSSHSLAPSHVLKALGVSDDKALGALRVSMGRYTTEEDIKAFVQALQKAMNW